jgi:hypothetical protein
LEKGIEVEITSFENVSYVDIQWGSTEDILQPANYVEHWRLIMWDKVFRVYFDNKGVLKFIKGLEFMGFEIGLIAIKRVAYQ